MQLSAPRLLAVSLTTGVLVFAIFLFWLHSPFVLAALGGAAFGAVFMLVAASIGDDPLIADEAWRAEAGDLSARPDRPADAPETPLASGDDGRPAP